MTQRTGVGDTSGRVVGRRKGTKWTGATTAVNNFSLSELILPSFLLPSFLGAQGRPHDRIRTGK
jgi:hypothetical protein